MFLCPDKKEEGECDVNIKFWLLYGLIDITKSSNYKNQQISKKKMVPVCPMISSIISLRSSYFISSIASSNVECEKRKTTTTQYNQRRRRLRLLYQFQISSECNIPPTNTNTIIIPSAPTIQQHESIVLLSYATTPSYPPTFLDTTTTTTINRTCTNQHLDRSNYNYNYNNNNVMKNQRRRIRPFTSSWTMLLLLPVLLVTVVHQKLQWQHKDDVPTNCYCHGHSRSRNISTMLQRTNHRMAICPPLVAVGVVSAFQPSSSLPKIPYHIVQQYHQKSSLLKVSSSSSSLLSSIWRKKRMKHLLLYMNNNTEQEEQMVPYVTTTTTSPPIITISSSSPLSSNMTHSLTAKRDHGPYLATTYQTTGILHKPSTTMVSSSSSSSSSTEGLSKFHHSILRHSGTNRQRFVTGKYPIVLTFRNNPTRKWLNLGLQTTKNQSPLSGKRSDTNNQFTMAETEVYVNGTLASQSLASLDRFYWYDDHERHVQQEQYGMLSMELLAEIHIDRPGYVTILSSQAGGRRTGTAYKIQQQHIQSGNRWTVQAMNLLKLYNEGHSRLSSHYIDDTSSMIPRNEHHRRFIEMAEDITSTNADRLWVTGFGLTGRQGSVTAIDCEQCYIQPLNDRSKNTMLWPNEVQAVPTNLLGNIAEPPPMTSWSSQQQRQMNDMKQYQDAILVCDGFLVPTKDRGGIYVVKNPGHETEWTISLTKSGERWFYHRAVWMDITGDGRQSIVTARCQVSTVLDARTNGNGIVTSGVTKSGQLLWLECPQPSMIDPITGTPLEKDGTIFDPFNTRHLPWKEHVLTTGPDVMFAVADLDTSDGTIEVLASEFFNKQVTLTSIQCGIIPRVVFKRVIDDQSGQAFGCILANFDTNNTVTSRCVVDAGSTVNCLTTADYFSHLLVTSHECNYVDNEEFIGESDLEVVAATNGKVKRSTVSSLQNPEGGSLFAYCVPEGKDAWRTEHWKRSNVASGFKVRGKLNNMINPGAPGFVYTFYANLKDAREKVKQPLIAVAGDCAESAFIFRPDMDHSDMKSVGDVQTNYKLMAEIQCEATVGSIGIGYNDFSSVEQEREYAKLYIPCFETDKIMVFGLGSGEDDDESNIW